MAHEITRAEVFEMMTASDERNTEKRLEQLIRRIQDLGESTAQHKERGATAESVALEAANYLESLVRDAREVHVLATKAAARREALNMLVVDELEEEDAE